MAQLELGPVDTLTVAMIRREPPLFHLQGRMGARHITVEMSLEMLQALMENIPEFLAEVHRKFPELPPELHASRVEPPPFLPGPALFRVGTVGLGYEPENDLILLELREQVERGRSQSPRVARLWCTREQILGLALHTLEVLQRALPMCPQCHQLVDDLETHVCPRNNGHEAG